MSMDRRDFIRSGLAVGAGLAGGLAVAKETMTLNFDDSTPFNCDFAPHFGMFGNHAGNNPIDELKFMIDKFGTSIGSTLQIKKTLLLEIVKQADAKF